MRIELRDERRRRVGRVHVDPGQRPTRVAVPGRKHDAFLVWDEAVDDAGHLRRCVVCGCPELFREKAFPQVTGIVVVLAFAGAVLGALGYATPPVLVAMVIVFMLDVGILLFSRRRLVCYRCRSSYHRLAIASYHAAWDRGTADRYAVPAEPPTARVLATALPVSRS